MTANCPDGCTNRPERWETRPSRKYSDRDAVRCKLCGRWIGYLTHKRRDEIARGKLRRTQKEAADTVLAPTADLFSQGS